MYINWHIVEHSTLNFFNFDFMLLCSVPKTSGLPVICSFDFYRQGLPILSIKSPAVTFRFGIIPPILILSQGPYRALYSSHTFFLISLSGANKTSITTPVTMTGLLAVFAYLKLKIPQDLRPTRTCDPCKAQVLLTTPHQPL